MITRPVTVKQDAANAMVILDADGERVCSFVEDDEGTMAEILENAEEIAAVLNAQPV